MGLRKMICKVRRSGRIASHVLTKFSNTFDKPILLDSEKSPDKVENKVKDAVLVKKLEKEVLQNMYKVIACTVIQKKSVVNTGFGSLLNFMVDGIPGRLAHYVIEKFDDKKMVIRVGGHKIRVNKEPVRNLLGLSYEGRRFEQITPLDVLDKSVNEWRDQYEGRFVGVSHLVDNIQHSEDKDDFNFRLNFVMMFVIVLVECTKNGRMKEDILRYFYHGTNFKQFDWCDFIIEKTKGCKSGWMPYDNSSPFTGP
ncbi:hypothetical protein R6Q59_012501 [Mikania micrantha]